jgi:hypothetical protein
LKIDVEGGEMDVLEGAKQVIEAYSPEIFIETHNRFVPGVHEACIAWLKKRGYDVAEFGSDRPPTEIFAKAISRKASKS